MLRTQDLNTQMRYAWWMGASDAAFERISSIIEMSPVMYRVKTPSTMWRNSAATLPPKMCHGVKAMIWSGGRMCSIRG